VDVGADAQSPHSGICHTQSILKGRAVVDSPRDAAKERDLGQIPVVKPGLLQQLIHESRQHGDRAGQGHVIRIGSGAETTGQHPTADIGKNALRFGAAAIDGDTVGHTLLLIHGVPEIGSPAFLHGIHVNSRDNPFGKL
jgi:hypothetical protein